MNMLRDYISERLIKKKQYWLTIWKKINLLRLCCQFHEQNIQTFRSLRGFTYFKRLISYVDCILKSDQLEDDIKELGFLDVCNEIMRAIDVIGLRTSNIEEKSSMIIFWGVFNFFTNLIYIAFHHMTIFWGFSSVP